MSEIPDPRTSPAAFWAALTTEQAFELLIAAPKVAIWRITRIGRVLDLVTARVQTRSIDGMNPPDPKRLHDAAQALGYCIANDPATARETR